MKIKEILSQSRRDFTAVFVCEHCEHEVTTRGYDDDYFHASVIPQMKCKQCDKVSSDTYRPLKTKHQSWETI